MLRADMRGPQGDQTATRGGLGGLALRGQPGTLSNPGQHLRFICNHG